jgi:hypothetical protein
VRLKLISLAMTASFALAGALSAQEVEERIQNGALSFSGGNGFTNAMLKITGPGEFEAEQTASRGLPVFRAKNSGRLLDGMYQYELSAATDEKVKIKKPVDNGRGSATRDYTMKPFHKYGAFLVKKGTIVSAENVPGGADGDATE